MIMKNFKLLLFVTLILLTCQISFGQVTIPKDRMEFLTAEWEGKRYDDGRPMVSDDLLKRLKNISIEEAWGVLRNKGFNNQFDADIARYIELTADIPDSRPAKERHAQIQTAKNRQQLDLSRNDQLLLTTYKEESDLILTRDQKLSSLDELIVLTQTRLQSLQIEMDELSDNADEYESRNKKVPEGLQGRMKNVLENIQQGEQLIVLKQQEKKQLEQQYNEDLKRYRMLTTR